MEISSFPFTASQDTFNSSFFNLTSSSDFFDPISINATSTTTTAATNSQINLSKRRKRIDHDAIAFQDADDSFFELDYLQGQEFNLSSFSFTPEMGQNKPTKDEEETQEQHFRESMKRAPRESVEEVESGEAAAAAAAGNTGTSQRRLWVKNRSKAWWELCNSPDFPEEEFKKSFRMSKSTFDMICEELESVVTKKDTMLRLAIPVRQRVAVCLWRLATGDPLREVSKRFGLGISTCHKLVLEVCSAIKNVLMPKFLDWPNEEKMREIKREFAMVSGIPNVGGSMHTTHVPIIAPKENVAAYFNKKHTERNQKTSYSITVQGVVDQKGAFTDIFVGWPGSMTDEKVLEHSALYKRANIGLLKDVMIVGNSGYPLMDWVLVPYRKQNLTWTQHALNERVEVVQNVAKGAFMRLKARWKCLQKRTEVKLQDLPVFLGACCVLHNICEKRNEEMSPDLRFDLFDDECIPDNPFRSVTAVKARDQIAHKLLHHNHAGTNFI